MPPKNKTVFDMDNWTTQLRKGILELCILELISTKQMYGYDIVKRLTGIQSLVISEGTVYPLLSRLKRANLVETHLQESTSGPARKYYLLTPLGRQALRQMKDYWKDIVSGVEELPADE